MLDIFENCVAKFLGMNVKMLYLFVTILFNGKPLEFKSIAC